jgi:hypothetical protein
VLDLLCRRISLCFNEGQREDDILMQAKRNLIVLLLVLFSTVLCGIVEGEGELRYHFSSCYVGNHYSNGINLGPYSSLQNITGLELRGSRAFSLSNLPNYPLRLEPGEVYTVNLDFDPVRSGTYHSQLFVRRDDHSVATYHSSHGGTAFYPDIRELPYRETFTTEFADQLPAAWSRIIQSTSYNVTAGLQMLDSYSYNCVWMHNGTQADPYAQIMLIAPPFAEGMATEDLRLRFRLKGSATSTNLIIGYITEVSDPGSFVPVDTLEAKSYWEEQFLNLGDYPDLPGRLAFKHGLGGVSLYLYLQDLLIEKIPEYDLALEEVTGDPVQSIAGDLLSYVRVKNMGTQTFDGYRLIIEDKSQNPLGVSPGLPVAPGQSLVVPVIWRATDASLNRIVARLEQIPGSPPDSNPYNNLSPEFRILLTSTQNHVLLGSGNVEARLPVVLNQRFSMSQTIIPAAEIGRTGTISYLRFYRTSSTAVPQNRVYQLFVGETDKTDLQDGWIPSSFLTRVHNSTITSLGSSLGLALSPAYEYRGRNLVIMLVPIGSSGIQNYDTFFRAQPAANLRTRYISGNLNGYDSNNPPQDALLTSLYPMTSVFFSGDSGYQLQCFPADKDFGEVVCGTAQTELFRIINPNYEAVEIVSATVQGDEVFSILEPAFPKVVNPGATLVVNLEYRPLSPGEHFAELILSDPWGRRVYVLPLSGQGRLQEQTELPLVQDFDSTSYQELPSGWQGAIFSMNGACSIGREISDYCSAPASLKFVSNNELYPLIKLSSPPLAEVLDITQMRLKFYARSTLPGVIKVGFCSDPDDPGDFSPLAEFSTTELWELKSCDFTAYQGGGRHLSLRYEGGVASNAIYIDDIRLERIPQQDLELGKLSFNGRVNLGQTFRIRCEIRNWGQESVSGYQISLISATEVLAVFPGLEIAPGQVLSVSCDWLPQDYQENLEMVINFPGDENPDNNRRPLPELVYSDTQEELSLGTGDRLIAAPLDYSAKNSLYQMLLSREELFGFYGWIGGLRIYPHFNNPVPSRPIRIWLGSTDQNDLLEGMIPVSEQELVFSDSLEAIPAGDSQIFIPFTQDFDFREGENLVLTFYREMDNVAWGFYKDFLAQPGSFGRQRLASSSTTEISPEYPPDGDLIELTPRLDLFVRSGGVGNLWGIVSSAGQAMDSVRVEILDKGLSSFTDSLGRYRFDNLPEGSYTLRFSKESHIHRELTASVVETQETCLNVSLEVYPIINISGCVKASDTAQGLSEANLYLSGAQNHHTTSSEDGYFVFTSVLGSQDYTLRISAPGYQSRELELQIDAIDLDLGEIVIAEMAYPPTSVQASEGDVVVQISWEAPNQQETGLFEDFDDISGWIIQSTNSGAILPSGLLPTWSAVGAVDLGTGPVAPYQGSQQAGLGWADSHQDEWLISPLFNCPTGATLSFWTWVYRGSSAGDHYYVKLSTDLGESWITLWDASNLTGAWNQYQEPVQIDLSEYSGQMIKLAWQAEDPPTNDGLWYNWLIDEVQVSNFRRREARSLQAYRIHRLRAGEEQSPEAWVLLGENTLSELSFIDDAWQQQLEGSYRWAVEAVYNAEVLSAPVFSNILTQDHPDGMISGVVRSSSGEPIAGAQVRASIYSATTNNSGAYLLILPIGSYTVTAEATGYESGTIEEVRVLEGQTSTANFTLSPGSANSQETEVADGLGRIYPNPFSASLTIDYGLREPANLCLEIYNLRGQLVKTLHNGQSLQGRHSLVWDGRDSSGRLGASGIYFLVMRSGGKSWSKKVLYNPIRR